MPDNPITGQMTLQQFIDLWSHGGKGSAYALRLYHNAVDFATEAGEFAKGQFAKSFETQKFLGIGEAWPESRMSRKHGHRTLFDHGQLAGLKTDKTNTYSNYRKEIYRRKSEYVIGPREKSYAEKKKRGLNKTLGNSYAAAHNDPEAVGAKVNQYVDRLQEKRQFIGHHKTLFEGIARFYPMIFDRIPQL